MLVKFSTLANGVFIEDNGTEERKPSDRCFRFDANGNAEYALFADLTGSNPAPRWFGHCCIEAELADPHSPGRKAKKARLEKLRRDYRKVGNGYPRTSDSTWHPGDEM